MSEIYNILTIITTIFLLGYWIGIFILSYHLMRFGIGVYPRRVAFIMVLGSLFLTILSILLLIALK